MSNSDFPNFFFFGTGSFAHTFIEVLSKSAVYPSYVITVPDAPKGRGLSLASPLIKTWAEVKRIPCLQLEKLTDVESEKKLLDAGAPGADFFLVADYGKIIPKNVFTLPRLGTLNIHPSLLPRLRGSSPISSAILVDSEVGVTIMRIDEHMDHGPIIAQKKVEASPWPMREEKLEALLAQASVRLFLNILPNWIEGKVAEIPQDESKATYTPKHIKKEDGLIDMSENSEENYRKFLAYHRKPGVFFFVIRKDKTLRVLIKEARVQNGMFIPIRVTPEGKKEMEYEAFLRGV
ncbi:MAG: methionyl-tRNA formyltransferase [Patescibacteria group bacterium]